MAFSIGAGPTPDPFAAPPAEPSAAEAADDAAEKKQARRERETAHEHAGAPSSASPHPHRSLHGVPLGHNVLRSRFAMNQLRRMNLAAFGSTANAALAQQASEAAAELSGERAPTTQTLENGDDALRRYIVLREAMDQAENKAGSDDLRQKLEQAIDDLLEQHGTRVAGDLSLANVLEGFSSIIDERDKLRRVYHDAVCLAESTSKMFECLTTAFTPDKVPEALKCLRHAITEEMLSPFAMNDPKHFATLTIDLQRVGDITAILRQVADLQKFYPSLLKLRIQLELTGRILQLVVEGGTASKLKPMSDWLAEAGDAGKGKADVAGGEEGASAGAATPNGKSARQQVVGSQERRVEALRRFLHDKVPARLWKPNARNSVTALPR